MLVAVAEAVARLKRYHFAGRYDSARTYPGHVYFVPDDTIISVAAQAVGITSSFPRVAPPLDRQGR